MRAVAAGAQGGGGGGGGEGAAAAAAEAAVVSSAGAAAAALAPLLEGARARAGGAPPPTLLPLERELALSALAFGEAVDAARTLQPHLLSGHVLPTAAAFHAFYEGERAALCGARALPRGRVAAGRVGGCPRARRRLGRGPPQREDIKLF